MRARYHRDVADRELTRFFLRKKDRFARETDQPRAYCGYRPINFGGRFDANTTGNNVSPPRNYIHHYDRRSSVPVGMERSAWKYLDVLEHFKASPLATLSSERARAVRSL